MTEQVPQLGFHAPVCLKEQGFSFVARLHFLVLAPIGREAYEVSKLQSFKVSRWQSGTEDICEL
jgi:hypothetical protein